MILKEKIKKTKYNNKNKKINRILIYYMKTKKQTKKKKKTAKDWLN